MFRLVRSQLRRQKGRSAAMALALLASVAAYTVLSATTIHQRTDLVGMVEQNDRGAYDLLVRAAGSQTSIEAKEDLVSPESLTALSEGITLAQWHQIESIPGIYAAAPVAVVGYEVPMLSIPIDLSKYVRSGSSGEVLAVDATQISENGLTKVPAGPTVYLYVTNKPLKGVDGNAETETGVSLCSAPTAAFTPDHPPLLADLACGSTNTVDTYNPKGDQAVESFGSTSGQALPTGMIDITWMFPVWSRPSTRSRRPGSPG